MKRTLLADKTAAKEIVSGTKRASLAKRFGMAQLAEVKHDLHDRQHAHAELPSRHFD